MIFYLIALALLVVLLFRSIREKIGTPKIDSSGFASADKGMIFSATGLWLCSKFNEREQSRPAPIKSGEVVTSQHRQDLSKVYSEVYISGLNDADIRQIYNDTFKHEKPFLNPYKAAFICPPCTLFWLAQIVFWLSCIWLEMSGFETIISWIFFEPIVLFLHNITIKITQ